MRLILPLPDGEIYVRILSDVADRQVDLVCTFARPDDSFLRLAFAADANVAVEAGHIVPINAQLLKRGKL